MTSRINLNIVYRFLLPAGIVALACLIAFYFVSTKPHAKPNPQHEVIRAVQVEPIKYGTLSPLIVSYGQVVSSREAEIRAMVAGRLTWVADALQDGAAVTAGTELFHIDRFDYDIALTESTTDLAEAQARTKELRAELNSEIALREIADAQLELRQRDLNRSADLRKKNQISDKALDDATIAFNTAAESSQLREQRISTLKARIEQQQAVVERFSARVQKAQRDVDDTVIRAPFDGYLTDTTNALGKRVGVGEALARLIADDEMQVRFQLANDDFARLVTAGNADSLIGRSVDIFWLLGNKKITFSGIVERTAAEIVAATGGVFVFVKIDPQLAPPQLRPVAFVEVGLRDIEYTTVFKLPERARDDSGTVYIEQDGRVAIGKAEIIRSTGAEVIVKSDLPEGTSIILTPFPGIGAGAAVRPM